MIKEHQLALTNTMSSTVNGRFIKRIQGGEFGRAGCSVFVDEHGDAYFDSVDLVLMSAKSINEGNFFSRRTTMTEDLKHAEEVVGKAIESLGIKTGEFFEIEKKISENSKICSGKIRDATQKISDSFKKLENISNFDKLERMIVLLERASDAMERLEKLQATGKLDKILAAIK